MEIIASNKVNDYCLEIEIKAEVPANTKLTYSRANLETQLERIQKQQDNENAQREKEKDEVKALLAECDKLGIKLPSQK